MSSDKNETQEETRAVGQERELAAETGLESRNEADSEVMESETEEESEEHESEEVEDREGGMLTESKDD